MQSDGTGSQQFNGAGPASLCQRTVGDSVSATMHSMGRADYRAGRPYSFTAARGWQEGWTYEAHLTACAKQAPELATVVAGLEMLTTIEALKRVLGHCIVARPTRHQQQIMAEARPLVERMIERLRSSEPPSDAATIDQAP